ncbi:flagellar biosynthesis protein [uncultured Roseibium sp.]|uniref:flagellar biosynthesis protein n=1 Tax=uncultured Roseibium sp. TaxID=1936171 RepID=UPI00261CDCED|nr:flagellar biosynthesis protein [uncultured Roseibium sp.]
MPKVGNYIQRDYHSKYRSQGKSTWSDYNQAWAQKRQASAERMQQLRAIANNFATIGTQASQANTAFIFQNRSQAGPYANATAVAARINVLV